MVDAFKVFQLKSMNSWVTFKDIAIGLDSAATTPQQKNSNWANRWRGKEKKKSTRKFGGLVVACLPQEFA